MKSAFVWLIYLRCVASFVVIPTANQPERLGNPFVRKPSLESGTHQIRSTAVQSNYNLPDGFEFYGMWPNDNGNSKNMVQHSFVYAMLLVQTTLDVLNGVESDRQPRGGGDPSFKRYWKNGDLPHFQAILGRLQAALGAPGYEAIRQCLSFPSMLLIYGDGPKEDSSGLKNHCTIANTFAYYSWFHNPATQEIRAYIAFCPLFFYIFKSPLKLANLPEVPYVNNQWLGNAIDGTDMSRPSEVTSGASLLMHELLHWPLLFSPFLTENEQIKDLILKRPDNQASRIAYRAFYATKVKDPAWQAKSDAGQSFQNPQRYNVDNYIYTILEIFYRVRYHRQPWQDPPDPLVGA